METLTEETASFTQSLLLSPSWISQLPGCIIEYMLHNKTPPNLCFLLAHVFVGRIGVLSVPDRLRQTWNVLTASLTGLGPQLSWLSGLEGWVLSSWDLSSFRSGDLFWLSS